MSGFKVVRQSKVFGRKTLEKLEEALSANLRRRVGPGLVFRISISTAIVLLVTLVLIVSEAGVRSVVAHAQTQVRQNQGSGAVQSQRKKPLAQRSAPQAPAPQPELEDAALPIPEATRPSDQTSTELPIDDAELIPKSPSQEPSATSGSMKPPRTSTPIANPKDGDEVVFLPPPTPNPADDDQIVDPGSPQSMKEILLTEFADRLNSQPKALDFLEALKARLAEDEYGVLENRGRLAGNPQLPKLQLLTSGDYAFRHGVKLIKFRYLDVRKGLIELNGFKLMMAPTRSASERWNRILQALPKKLDLANRSEFPMIENLLLPDQVEASDSKRAPKTVAMAIASSAMAFVGYNDSLCFDLLSTDKMCRSLSEEIRDRVEDHLEKLKIPDPVTGRLRNQSRCLSREVMFEEKIRTHLVEVRSLLAAYAVDVEKLYKPYEGLCKRDVETAKSCWKTLQNDMHKACIPFPNLNE